MKKMKDVERDKCKGQYQHKFIFITLVHRMSSKANALCEWTLNHIVYFVKSHIVFEGLSVDMRRFAKELVCVYMCWLLLETGLLGQPKEKIVN